MLYKGLFIYLFIYLQISMELSFCWEGQSALAFFWHVAQRLCEVPVFITMNSSLLASRKVYSAIFPDVELRTGGLQSGILSLLWGLAVSPGVGR